MAGKSSFRHNYWELDDLSSKHVDQLIIRIKTNIMLEFLSACSPGQSLYPLRASSLIVTKIRLYRVCKKLSTSHHSAVCRVSCMTASVSHMTVKEYWPALSTGNPSKQTCHALSCPSPFNVLTEACRVWVIFWGIFAGTRLAAFFDVVHLWIFLTVDFRLFGDGLYKPSQSYCFIKNIADVCWWFYLGLLLTDSWDI